MNRGAELLKASLLDRGAQAKLARTLKVDPGAVSRWLSGELKPGIENRKFFEDEYGISWRSWDEESAEEPTHSAESERAS